MKVMKLKSWFIFVAAGLMFIYFGLALSRPLGNYVDRMLSPAPTDAPEDIGPPPPLLYIPPPVYGRQLPPGVDRPPPPLLYFPPEAKRQRYDEQTPGDPGPSTSGYPGPSTSSDPGPSTSRDPGPSTSRDPGPSTSRDPGPSTSQTAIRRREEGEPEIRTGPKAAQAELMNEVILAGFRCPEGDVEPITLRGNFKRHMLIKHGKDPQGDELKNIIESEGQGHECFYCLYGPYLDPRTLAKHFIHNHAPNGSCPVCPEETKYGLNYEEMQEHFRRHQKFYAMPNRPGVGAQSDRDSSLEYNRHYISNERRLRSPKQGLSHSITEQLLHLTKPEHDEPRVVAERTPNQKEQFLADTFSKDRVTGAEKKLRTRPVKRGGGELLNAIGKESSQLKKFRQEKLPQPRRFNQRG